MHTTCNPGVWRQRVDGLVAHWVELSLDALMRMPSVSYTVKHHCVEGWSAIASWHGVPVSAIVEQVRPIKAARYISFVSFDADRSEERRVGKECRSRWSPYH